MDTALPQIPALLPVLLTVLQFLRWFAQKNGDGWGDLALLLPNGQLAPSTKLGLCILVGSCFSNPYVVLFTLNAESQECFLVHINSHFRVAFCLQGLHEWQLFTEHSCRFPQGTGGKRNEKKDYTACLLFHKNFKELCSLIWDGQTAW